jgi:hypothetical protein
VKNNLLPTITITLLILTIFMAIIPMAASASMTIYPAAGGTSTWTTAKAKVGFGSLYVQLPDAVAMTQGINVEIFLDNPVLIDDLTETDFWFWEYIVNTGGIDGLGAKMCLLVDTTGDEIWVWGEDVQIIFGSFYVTPLLTDTWVQRDLTGRYGFDKILTNIGNEGPLADFQALYSGKYVLGVNIIIGWGHDEDYESYWDDVIVHSVTYPLEPTSVGGTIMPVDKVALFLTAFTVIGFVIATSLLLKRRRG